MPPHNGIYEIINVATGLYFELKGSSGALDNNIIGYPRTGNANQKWILQRGEGNTIILAPFWGFGGVANKSLVPGSEVVLRPRPDQYEIIDQQNKVCRIKVVDKDLFMGVATGVPATPVTIDLDGLGNDVWRFDSIPV